MTAVSGDEAVVVVKAVSDTDILGFQLELNGVVIGNAPAGAVVESGDGEATLTWNIAGPHEHESHLRIRARGRSGVFSRSVLLTLIWK
jgi:hypothetical protein